MVHLPESAYWLALAYARGFSLARAKTMVGAWCLEGGQPLSTLFDLDVSDAAGRVGLTHLEWEALRAMRGQIQDHAAWLAQLEGDGIHVLNRLDARYPASLARSLPILSQPLLLFCRGNLDILDQVSVAFVGGRNATPETLDVVRDVVRLLAADDVVIVSGLGRGAGRAAMQGAIEENHARAVAVLPMGISCLEIESDMAGALDAGRVILVSPFHPQAGFSPANALARDRLMGALAEAVVVVEADGADTMLEMGQDVLAMGKGLYVCDLKPEGDQPLPGQRSLIEAGGLPIRNMPDVVNMLDSLLSIVLERETQEEATIEPANRTTVQDETPDEFDPRAAFDLLSRSGQMPDTLRTRLGKGLGISQTDL